MKGGTTNHWGGLTPRFKPEDFELKSRTGFGVDWPINYDDMAPYYAEAEILLGITGDSENDDPPRYGAKYPFPPTAFTLGDALIIESSHLLENYTGPQGNPVSEETTTVETYRRMDVPNIGAALAMDMVVTDPKYLTGPWTLSWQKFYTPGYEFIEVDCRVPYTYREAERI